MSKILLSSTGYHTINLPMKQLETDKKYKITIKYEEKIPSIDEMISPPLCVLGGNRKIANYSWDGDKTITINYKNDVVGKETLLIVPNYPNSKRFINAMVELFMEECDFIDIPRIDLPDSKEEQ